MKFEIKKITKFAESSTVNYIPLLLINIIKNMENIKIQQC